MVFNKQSFGQLTYDRQSFCSFGIAHEWHFADIYLVILLCNV